MHFAKKMFAFFLPLVTALSLFSASTLAADRKPKIASVTEKDYFALGSIVQFEQGIKEIPGVGIILSRQDEKSAISVTFTRDARPGTLTLITKSQKTFLEYQYDVSKWLGTSITLAKSAEQVRYHFDSEEVAAPEGYCKVDFTGPAGLHWVIYSQLVEQGDTIDWQQVFAEYARFEETAYVTPSNTSHWALGQNSGPIWGAALSSEEMADLLLGAPNLPVNSDLTLRPYVFAWPKGLDPDSSERLVKVSSAASIAKLQSSTSLLSISVTERYIDGTENVLQESFTILNNTTKATYFVGAYKVLVEIGGGSQVRRCVIIE